MRSTFLAIVALAVVAPLHAPATARQESRQPAFTLRSRVTVTRDDGGRVVLNEVRYVSSNGDFRVVRTQDNGSSAGEWVYVKGRGLLLVNHYFRMLRKWKEPLPDATDAPPPTAEQLQASPNFVRTETVLERTTYLHRVTDERTGQQRYDYYFTPELGKTPLKSIEYRDGKVLEVVEPVSVAFGEPEPAAVRAPDYEEVEQFPISGGVLNGKAVKRPAPDYPKDSVGSGASGVVVVQVVVDEEGKVIVARAVSGHPLLQKSAVEAAYKTRFSPTKLSGKPVKVSGTLTYNFVLK
jgi:TonB family protein